MILYLSGPMRSKPNHNYETFYDVEYALYADPFFTDRQSLDLIVINPANNFNGDKTLTSAEYMSKDIPQVVEADGLILLPDWEDSEGAKLEVAVARATGKSFWLANHDDSSNPSAGWRFDRVDEPFADTSPRAQSLDRAKSYITGDRNASYGSPIQDFARTARAWNAYGYRAPDGREFVGHDVAILMMLLKLSRITWSPEKTDSWDDISGYAACGYECVTFEGDTRG